MSDKLFLVTVSISGPYDSKVIAELVWAANNFEALGRAYVRATEDYSRYNITHIHPKEVTGLIKQEDVQHDMDLLSEYETIVHRIKQECKDLEILKMIAEAGL